MKKTYILIITLFSFWNCISAQNKTNLNQNNISNDTVFKYQKRFQEFVDKTTKIRPFNLEKEILDPTLLSSKEELKQYISFMIKMKYPDAKFSKILVSEDRTKKIWFAYTMMENSLNGNDLLIIICKDNNKVLLFNMDR